MPNKHETLDDYIRNVLDDEPERLTTDEKVNLAFTYIRRLEDRVTILESRLDAAAAAAEADDGE